jgi:hypothetical protein
VSVTTFAEFTLKVMRGVTKSASTVAWSKLRYITAGGPSAAAGVVDAGIAASVKNTAPAK